MTEDGIIEDPGIVYILQNPAFHENIVKIGSTSNLKDRMRQLYSNSGVPARFTCYYARRVHAMRYVENKIHSGLSSKRINPDREFFDIDPQEVKSILEIAPGEDVTPKNELEDVTQVEKNLARRTMFRFSNFDILPGFKLTFKQHPSITAEVHPDGKNLIIGENSPEEMRGNTYSISRSASDIVGYTVGGTDHWMFDGRTLNEIRIEKESGV